MTTEVEQQIATPSPASDAAGRPNFELLASYLEPKFGNIYEYNLNGGDAGIEVQEWTDEIRDAIRDYLLYKLPDDVASVLFGLDTDALRDVEAKQEAVRSLIANNEPWHIALEVREAAVRAVPTLDQLIGNLATWPSEEERWDVLVWLDQELSEPDLEEMALALGWRPGNYHFGVRSYLTETQKPPALLREWHRLAAGPAPSDLTDDEWNLLVQALPSGTPGMKTEHGVSGSRRAIDGMLYRQDQHVPWYHIPRRYGSHSSIQGRHTRYKTSGVFAHALAALEGTPGTERLVEWLRLVESASMTSKTPE